MALFKDSDLRARASRSRSSYKTYDSILNEKIVASVALHDYDIFLSHSFSDKELILGIYLSLEDMGYSVYIDWIKDRAISRDTVTRETAAVLRNRMESSKSLFFATTTNSSTSKWMPWELGFKDGKDGRSAILPVVQGAQSNYEGQEYLGIYPYISKETARLSKEEKLWVNRSSSCYVLFDDWLIGKEPYERG